MSAGIWEHPDGRILYLLDLLRAQENRMWRRGILQAARSFGVITQAQWADLTEQWVKPTRKRTTHQEAVSEGMRAYWKRRHTATKPNGGGVP